MLSDKLISDKTQTSSQSDTYEPRSYECTPLDRTFAWGFVLVMTIVGVILYFTLYYWPY
jgi:hypothetical protein